MNDNDTDLRRIFGVLRRQARLIFATLIVITSIAGLAAYAMTPIFSATALVLYDTRTKNLLDPETSLASASADSSRIDSEVEIMRSDSILLKVISSQNLIADTEFGPSLGWRARLLSLLRLSDQQVATGEEALNDTLGNLRRALQVQRRGLTYLISIRVQSRDKEKAARLATAVANAYIADQLESKINSVMASRDILQARVDSARQSIVSSENSFDEFIQGNIDRITAESGDSGLVSMQTQLQQLEAQRDANEQRVQQAQQQLADGNLASLVSSLQSDALTELQRQRDELAASLDASSPDSPAAVDLRTQLERIDQNLRTTATSEIDRLQTAVQGTDESQQNLRDQMREQVLSTKLSADMLTELYGLQQSAEIARNQYQTLLSRVQDLDAQANLQVADSRLVSPALPPEAAAFPNRPLIILLGALGGLGLGIALAFLYENLIGGFTSDEQVESVLGVKFGAAIPFRPSKSQKKSLADMLVEEPLSLFAESIRRVRTAIDRPFDRRAMLSRDDNSGGPARARVIMVTSSAPNDGKSTISLALARTYALAGYRTLLIDCDMRKPTLHRQLDIEPSGGLLEFLKSPTFNAETISRIVCKDPLTDLTIIPGSRGSDTPTDQLLASVTFSRMLDATRLAFDAVILDTPPLGPVVDGLYVAPHANAVIFVTRWATTSQADAKRSINALNEAKRPEAEIIAVLNQQREARANYQHKYGGYYAEN